MHAYEICNSVFIYKGGYISFVCMVPVFNSHSLCASYQRIRECCLDGTGQLGWPGVRPGSALYCQLQAVMNLAWQYD